MEDYYEEKLKKSQKRKLIRKVLVKVIYILLLPIILWELIIVIKTIKNPNETPDVFGIKTFTIISGSMEPNISVNDLVIIKEVEKNEIKKGDIISFRINGETITHRVTNIETDTNGENLYTTQGDANNIQDYNKIKYENIEGKYIGKIPKIGGILIALKSKEKLTIIIAILLVIYVLEERNSSKKIRRNKTRIDYENENENKGDSP